MAMEDAAGPSSQSGSSSKRLSYVPYQRKGHQRNGSTASQSAAFSPEAEPALSRPTGEPASTTKLLPNTGNASSGASTPKSGTATPDHMPIISTPLRPQATPSRTPSTPSRPAIASPLARGAGLVRPHRDLDAPPPPLRVASKLGTNNSQPKSSASISSQGGPSSSRSQTSSSSAALPASSANRHGRSQSSASTSTLRAVDPSRSPQKLPGSPRTSSMTQNHSTRALVGTNSTNGASVGANSANSGTPIPSSAASSVLGSSRASSAVASPLGSRSSTPIIGASGTSIPAHVNSYAALLAAQSRLGPIPVPQGVALAQAAGASPASANQQMALPGSDGRRTAYRSGFQPKGVLRVRTAEFTDLRRKGHSEGEMEAQRMDRRLAKLIAIHFAPINDAEKLMQSPAKKSAFMDLDLDELKRDPSSVIRKGGSELWTSFRARGRGEDPSIRQAEQSIVNWQDDAEAKACPICATPFSFTVRKHHCRLCGRVVCASPHLTRLAWAEQMGSGTGKTLTAEERAALDGKCSGNIVADPISGRIEEVKEGAAASSSTSPSKGVRICLDCKSIVRKRQYMMDDEPLPIFMKLYEALMRVQKEIEQSLPEFQEMVLGLQKQDQTAALGSSIRANIELQRDAVQARKQLLANFATYDELAKRIRALPVGDKANTAGFGSDAAQERIQHAIFTRANLFLQQNMLPLQSLPKPGSKKTTPAGDAASDSTGSSPGSPQPASPRLAARRGGQHAHKGSVSSLASIRSLFGGGGVRANAQAGLDEQFGNNYDDGSATEDDTLGNADPAELREQLKVLLEQEKLVADYVESAARARKFEDAKTLKKSHDELCKEIVRIQRRLVVAGKGR
ncbi:related to vacuolar segregation protein PEP7 [Ustilago trichophora]|uniref:Related to vacuolar segregation protein PEP7 n=1 Tax=Ustilago trichophora TaxID=86804 RepID=A0A5C3DTR1_9BASI|nr:related to vacuolar segregation protein PEP7 [Ustilago trichophora]